MTATSSSDAGVPVAGAPLAWAKRAAAELAARQAAARATRPPAPLTKAALSLEDLVGRASAWYQGLPAEAQRPLVYGGLGAAGGAGLGLLSNLAFARRKKPLRSLLAGALLGGGAGAATGWLTTPGGTTDAERASQAAPAPPGVAGPPPPSTVEALTGAAGSVARGATETARLGWRHTPAMAVPVGLLGADAAASAARHSGLLPGMAQRSRWNWLREVAQGTDVSSQPAVAGLRPQQLALQDAFQAANAGDTVAARRLRLLAAGRPIMLPGTNGPTLPAPPGAAAGSAMLAVSPTDAERLVAHAARQPGYGWWQRTVFGAPRLGGSRQPSRLGFHGTTTALGALLTGAQYLGDRRATPPPAAGSTRP
jgi:hypothetical protein